ncbi:LacI family DNA-binding transcriptional regulator [Planomonospora venezuelensis]|uniref:LacI family transcriptional regulator n=1 Tax=Planomonospora venezuelensis TaxID=1999 RepID=A0A841CYH6_PLAVE|nr:LacI family DNA-binding transcriptional regulator [Planomonospora venezuelensis]MBB5962480.1 LacI family transcriptional regulator [Planomonospora venezuelensis]GIN00863.1 LacI family transcriptional regulator [Planomonospora venezuelensis]
MTAYDRRRRVTIADVAGHAQVSTTAVSKVLRNAYGVSPAMREKVQAAIDELGYRPHAAARAMRGRTFTVGVLLPHIRNPFFADVLDGLMDQLAGTGYQAIIVQGGGADPEAERRAVEALTDRQVDGMLMIAPLASKADLEETARTTALVVLGRHDRSAVYDSVFDDDETGAELVVGHLLALGHRRIAHISQKDGSRVRPAELLHTIRARTYRRVMEEHGLADEVAVATTSYTEEGGYLGARELLARPSRPTALFAGADLAAFGALAAIHEAGLAVPGDISLAGYDNTRTAALAHISLTSVDQDGATMGGTAGRLLLERIGGRTSAVRFSVTPTLVPRRSTGPSPDGETRGGAAAG